jgi:hypothetical protein
MASRASTSSPGARPSCDSVCTGNGQAAHASGGKNRDGARIRGTFENYRIARPKNRFAEKIEGLLASVGDQQLFRPYGHAFRREHHDDLFFERLVSIGVSELQDSASVGAEDGVGAAANLLDREKFFGRARGDKGDGVARDVRGEAAQSGFAALVGEERFPAYTAVFAAVAVRADCRGEGAGRGVSTDECAAADVAFDKAFGFQLGVGVGYGGAVDAQLLGQFAAGGNAIAQAQFAGMDQGAQLVSQLDVEGNAAFQIKGQRRLRRCSLRGYDGCRLDAHQFAIFENQLVQMEFEPAIFIGTRNFADDVLSGMGHQPAVHHHGARQSADKMRAVAVIFTRKVVGGSHLNRHAFREGQRRRN